MTSKIWRAPLTLRYVTNISIVWRVGDLHSDIFQHFSMIAAERHDRYLRMKSSAICLQETALPGYAPDVNVAMSSERPCVRKANAFQLAINFPSVDNPFSLFQSANDR
jgi:hypothetical protein